MSQFQREHFGASQIEQGEQSAIPDISGERKPISSMQGQKTRFQMKGSSSGRHYNSRTGHNAVELQADSHQHAAMKEIELRQAVMRAAMYSS